MLSVEYPVHTCDLQVCQLLSDNLQVKSAYSDSTQVTKSNCDYIRVVASKWRAFNPISVAALLIHLNAALPKGGSIPENAAAPKDGAAPKDAAVPKDGDRSALRAVVSRRALGMKLLCLGVPLAYTRWSEDIKCLLTSTLSCICFAVREPASQVLVSFCLAWSW